MKTFAVWSLLFVSLVVPLPQTGTASPTANVSIVDFFFDPVAVSVDFALGGSNSIIFAYDAEGQFTHRAHSDLHNDVFEGSCLDMAVDIQPGQTVEVPLTVTTDCIESMFAAGGLDAVTPEGPVIFYHCHIHPQMKGRIVLNLV